MLEHGFQYTDEMPQWIGKISSSIEYTHYHYSNHSCEETVFNIDPKHKLFSTMDNNLNTIQQIRNEIDKGVSFQPNDYTDTNMEQIINEIAKVIHKS